MSEHNHMACSASFIKLSTLICMRRNIENYILFCDDRLNDTDATMIDVQPFLNNLNQEDKLLVDKYNQLLHNSTQLCDYIHVLKQYLVEIHDKIKTTCCHEWITDSIDTGYDESMDIHYCSICLTNRYA